MVNLAIAIVLFAHGIGHVLFLAPTLRIADWAGQTGYSWALAPILGDGLARGIGTALWAGALALFVAAAGGYLVDATWWRTVALVASVVSAAGIVVMWNGIATSSAVFALVVDVIVIAALILRSPAASGASS
jgi:hypothetical protein